MNLPIAFGSQTGMPVGLQIIGPQFRDEHHVCELQRRSRRSGRFPRSLSEEVSHKMKELEEVLQDWEAVIGLEIHAELTTLHTKMFCALPASSSVPSPTRIPVRSAWAFPARFPCRTRPPSAASCIAGLGHELRNREALDVLPQELYVSRYGEELPDHAGPCGILHARAPRP